MKKVIKYVLLDILRNRIVISYALFLLLVSLSVFNLEGDASKGVLSLLNVVLIFVPLMSGVFSTIYFYNVAEFIELLVAQPVPRRHIWLSIFSGLSSALSLAFIIGCGIPILFYAPTMSGAMLVIMGVFITVIFIALALWASVRTRDKARGIGVALLLWLFFTLIYDGWILFLMFRFMDYPLETPMIVSALLNPIDLARILILLQLDISVLMGATSAVFKTFLGSNAGIGAAIAALVLWSALPFWFSLRYFNRKDL